MGERERKREESWRVHEPLIISTDEILFLREGTEFMVVVPVSSVTETCNGAVTEFRFKRCWVSVSKRAFFYILPFLASFQKQLKRNHFL